MCNTTKKIASILCASALLISVPVTLTGCMGGGSSSSNDNTMAVSQTAYTIELGAVNNMVNNALKLTVTDIQRRPTSVFSGSNISKGSGNADGMDGTSETQVGAANATDIAIQVDISLTWNVNTYTQAVLAAGGQASNVPETLEEALMPGTYMYISGTDADGNDYMSADIISPSAQENVNALAINAQWDYDIMHSQLPEASVTKTGSFLIRVPSTVDNLKLNIMTPAGGQEIGGSNDITTGTTYIYELPLS